METAIRLETPKNNLNFKWIVVVILLMGMAYTAHNYITMKPTLHIETDDLSALEKRLEKRLEQVREGLPLTPEQVEQLQEVYAELLKKGGRGDGLVEHILLLCKQIVLESGMMEMELEHAQNGHQDEYHEVQGMARGE